MPRTAAPAAPDTPDSSQAAAAASMGDQALPATYEAAVAELESLVASMEEAALPLDTLLDSYRRAAALLQFCRARLADVESQVKVFEDGQLRAWTPDAG